MRIHSATLTPADVTAAARAAGITVQAALPHRSRSHGSALEVAFSGSGRRGGQWGTTPYAAATWDEWGMALAHLFEIDHDAVVAHTYQGIDDFHWRTGNRFQYLRPAQQHRQHRWIYVGESATSTYIVHECKCGARTRRPR